MHATKNKTMYELIFSHRNLFLDIAMIMASVLFMAIMAQLRIPLWPVPITMQTFGIFTIAFFFGSGRGLISILVYVLVGIAGFSVFSGFGSGMAKIVGPTGGYIIGFVFMVYLVGLMIEKGYGRTRWSILLCMLLGEIVLYAFGLTGLWIALSKPPVIEVLQKGLFPFIIGDTIKALLATGLFPYLWKGAEKMKV